MNVKGLVRPKFSLFLLLGLLLALMLAPAAKAAVSTDAYVYDFGDTVQINGNEMLPGENVTVSVYEPGGLLLAAEPWTVPSDNAGAFATSFLLTADMPGGVYTVMAVGETSGNTYSCEFDPDKFECTTVGTIHVNDTVSFKLQAQVSGSKMAWSETPPLLSWGDGSSRSLTASEYVTLQFTGSNGEVTVTHQYTSAKTGCSPSLVVYYIDNDTPNSKQIDCAAFDVVSTNSSPTIDSIGNKTTEWGGPALTFTAVGHGDTGETLHYGLSTGAPGSINESTGAYSWTPASSNIGAYTFSVIVYDGVPGATGVLSASTSVTIAVTTRAVTITADAKTKTYGDTDPALTYQITSGSLAFSDEFAGALSRDAGEIVGDYPITQGTVALSSNYTLSYVGANLTIDPRLVTITADALSKTYGDTDPALTYQITSGTLAFSDEFAGALSRDAGEIVGDYPITQGTVALSSNYTLSYVGANLTIDPRLVTVTADPQEKVFGVLADPALTYQITSGTLAFSDEFTGALSREPGEAWGSYEIQQGTLALNDNYTLTYEPGTFLIIDVIPPTSSATSTPDANGAGWNKTNVTVTITAADTGGSGVKDIHWTDTNGDAGSSLGASAVVELTAEGEHTFVYWSVDRQGLSSEHHTMIIKIDKTNPTVTFTTTTHTYQLGSTASAAWTASDDRSGVVPPDSGSKALTTSAVTKTGDPDLTVSATVQDEAGNSATATFSYRVVYFLTSTRMHFLQPINSDGSSVFKLGSTIPCKFQLRDATNNFITTAQATMSFTYVDSSPDGTVVEPVVIAVPTGGTSFRYDVTANQYIYNLATLASTTKNTGATFGINKPGDWQVMATLDDGSQVWDRVSVKR